MPGWAGHGGHKHLPADPSRLAVPEGDGSLFIADLSPPKDDAQGALPMMSGKRK